jgi:hypothetical protein
MAQFDIKYQDWNGEAFSLQLTTGEQHRIRLLRKRGDLIEFADTLFRFNSAALLPSEIAPSTDGAQHAGMDVVAACLRYAQVHLDKKMLITGHTDTVGSDEANMTLSQIRAQAVHGMLSGDRDEFGKACWGPHLTREQRYPHNGDGSEAGVMWLDYADVLNWVATEFGWPCQTGYPESATPGLWSATQEFQKSYNASDVGGTNPHKPIPESGWFDEPAWGAVYDCYELKLAEVLGVDLDGLRDLRDRIWWLSTEIPWVGCGEYHPLDQVGRDGYRSQTNRRVEVRFFDLGEEPTIGCLDGSCTGPDCELYNPLVYRRHHLPPVASIAPWAAGWDHPSEPAGIGTTRNMILEASDLPEGESVLFEVFQATPSRVPISPPITGTIQDGRAVAEFRDWFAPERVASKVALKDGEKFSEVSFLFVASAGGDQIESQPLPYSDIVDLQFVFSDGADTPASERDYVLLSPWGSLRGKTTKSGNVRVEGLPPGGAKVVVLDVDPFIQAGK